MIFIIICGYLPLGGYFSFLIRGGYAEVVNMDDDVMALLQKSISAKLCPTVLGQACMDIVANPPKPGEPSYNSWLQEKEVELSQIFC